MPETDQAVLMEILQRITKIETKIENLTNLDRVAADAYKVANEALQSSKAAHHRLDELQAVKATAEEAVRRADDALEQLEQIHQSNKWLRDKVLGTAITALVGILVAAAWAAIQITGGGK
ncbi:hypothetical protein [Gorillibacterium sp. CAU 1737]|uniref:hypothetical protein n=1 Tax=Gorillibacterium sp. CAU 1737 TaxID=3140362 RepID=UPI0032612779